MISTEAGWGRREQKGQQKGLLLRTLVTGWDGIGVLWESS